MKKMTKTRIFIWILALAPFVLVAVMYGRLPDEIPIHWNINSEVDSFGNKAILWWLSCISPVLAVLLVALPNIDPRKKNYSKFRGFYDAFVLVMMLFMLMLVGMTIFASLNLGKISIETVVVIAVGLLFVIIGNMLPKVKSNYFMGVKTPWALSNDEVWNKTHRLAGYLFFFGGVITIIIAFFLKQLALFIGLIAIVTIIVVVPTVMSYVWYKRLPQEQ